MFGRERKRALVFVKLENAYAASSSNPVRPDHRMIAHTGFLMTARRLAPGAVLPQLKRRASKSDYTDDDVELWTPGALGERSATAKKLRKTARQARIDQVLATGAPAAIQKIYLQHGCNTTLYDNPSFCYQPSCNACL